MEDTDLDEIMDELYDHLYFEGHGAALMEKYFSPREYVSDKEVFETLLPLCKLLNRLFFAYKPDGT